MLHIKGYIIQTKPYLWCLVRGISANAAAVVIIYKIDKYGQYDVIDMRTLSASLVLHCQGNPPVVNARGWGGWGGGVVGGVGWWVGWGGGYTLLLAPTLLNEQSNCRWLNTSQRSHSHTVAVMKQPPIISISTVPRWWQFYWCSLMEWPFGVR